MYISEIEEIEELTGYIEGCGDCGCSSGNSGGSEPPQTSDHYYAKLSNCPYVLTKIKTVQLVRMEGE